MCSGTHFILERLYLIISMVALFADEYSCLSVEVLDDGVNTYYIRYEFLDTTQLTCVHDQTYQDSGSNTKYILHREQRLGENPG